MSGGTFNYKQYVFTDIAARIEEHIEHSNDPDNFAQGYPHSAAVVKELKKAIKAIREAAVYAHNVDYLIAADHDEEGFLTSLKEDLEELRS